MTLSSDTSTMTNKMPNENMDDTLIDIYISISIKVVSLWNDCLHGGRCREEENKYL